MPCSAYATCQSTGSVTKCMTFDAEIVDFSEGYANEETGAWTLTAWIRSDMFSEIYYLPMSGRLEGESGIGVSCSIYSPFNMSYTAIKEPGEPLVSSCLWGIVDGGGGFMELATALPDDVCPDGFYTVPYDISCGVGLVEVSDIPQCDTDTSGEFCLIGGDVAAPCAAGVTTLRTGTGLIIPLWADKNTTPALHVRYNGTVCYINLEPGNAANAINVEYGGVVYHTVN